MLNRFWNDWELKSSKEDIAIDSIEKAIKTLFEFMPKEKIISIYIKGSFVRREMDENSDVDIVPIMLDNESLKKVKELNKSRATNYAPSELLPRSLEEFENNKRYSKTTKLQGGIDTFLRNLHNYKLIYGQELDPKKYKIRSDKEFLQGHLFAFRNTFIPMYENKEFGFRELIKQIFFLVQREIRLEGKEPPSSWNDLSNSIKDKEHIVHDALRLRLNPTKDSVERENLLKKLQKYIEELETKLNIDNRLN
ncbi:nucleotidyltransferase domain-containing protein [Candidatus Woesearchaeota archaeon]|nr:nucleotidyltransferase domain-containing protein [Candidatus Woesearchaeota archaeon]MCF7901486.1 nucleotidyltransferase domain-containing protein [Candidatus Woesearchaeota archaeon]MCF8013181.1 nucleotidyltransferase domain-containing protein [Candidatus Woesearchaeota archaeon]